MNPRDYKNKAVLHLPTQTAFLVTGGMKKAGKWYLKSELPDVYPLEECQLINSLESDISRIKAADSAQRLDEIFKMIGAERFQEVWIELEKDSVEAALVAILYCDNWGDFEAICEGYGVSSKHSENQLRNDVFRSRLKHNETLSQQVANWYTAKEAV